MKPASTFPSDGPVRFIPQARSGLPADRLRIVGDGAVLEDIDCSGCYVSVEASNVTLRRCRFTAIAGIAIIVDLYANGSNLTVERCHFDGLKANTPTDPMLRARNGVMHVRDCLFENLPSDGISTVGGTVERCVFRASGYLAGAHADAVTIARSVAPLIIMDNEIDFRKRPDALVEATSAIAVGPGTGNVVDVLIEKNRLRGGAYCLYVTQRDPRFTARQVIVRDNLIGDWLYGPLFPRYRPPDLVFEGNRLFGTGARLVQ